MTVVLYPIFGFTDIVKDWNETESFAFEGVICDYAKLIQMKI